MTLLSWLVRCKHNAITWPQTTGGGFQRRTYVVCTDCGQEFDYSWAEMRILGESKRPVVKQKPLAPVVQIDADERRKLWGRI